MTELAVSTIIPTYNRAHVVGRAVESALTASKDRDEVIVVDDGSTDNTAEVLARFGGGMRLIRIPNSSAGTARNAGIAEARHDLVAFLDSDDEWMPFKLDLQRRLMSARPDILFCFTDFIGRDESGSEHRKSLNSWHRDERPWREILGEGIRLSNTIDLPSGCRDADYYVGNLYDAEMSRNYVFTSTLVARRVEALTALHFAEDLPLYEDWFCFGLLAGIGYGAYIDCETAFQNADAGDRLTHARSLAMAEARIAVMERIWGKDESFLARMRSKYEREIDRQREMRIKDLLILDRIPEARAEFSLMRHKPVWLRAALLAPDPIVSRLIKLQRVAERRA